MKKRQQVSVEEAVRIGEALYFDWDQVDPEKFRQDLMGSQPQEAMDPKTGLPYDSLLLSGKVVLNHMQEFSDYFTRLEKLKSEVDQYQARRR